MTPAQAKKASDRLVETVEHADNTSLEAIRKFVDTVNSAFPELREDGPRRKIIDSAFEMTEKLVSTSTRLAQNIFDTTQKALADIDRSAPAKKAAKKATTKKATTKKASTKR